MNTGMFAHLYLCSSGFEGFPKASLPESVQPSRPGATFPLLFFPKSQDKRDCLHLISRMAFRRHVKWLSERAGGHTGSFI